MEIRCRVCSRWSVVGSRSAIDCFPTAVSRLPCDRLPIAGNGSEEAARHVDFPNARRFLICAPHHHSSLLTPHSSLLTSYYQSISRPSGPPPSSGRGYIRWVLPSEEPFRFNLLPPEGGGPPSAVEVGGRRDRLPSTDYEKRPAFASLSSLLCQNFPPPPPWLLSAEDVRSDFFGLGFRTTFMKRKVSSSWDRAKLPFSRYSLAPGAGITLLILEIR